MDLPQQSPVLSVVVGSARNGCFHNGLPPALGRFQLQKATVVMAGFDLPPFSGVPFESPS